MNTSFKILITAYDYRPRFGGVATAAFEIAKALSETPGIEVKVIARSYADPIADSEFDKHGFFSTERVALPGESLLAAFALARTLRKTIHVWRPDAILNLLWLPCGVASWLGQLGMGTKTVPYFLIAHGVEVMETDRNLKKRLRRYLSGLKRKTFRSARHVFAVSEFTARLLEQYNVVSRSQVSLTFNGVDPKEFFPKKLKVESIRLLGLSEELLSDSTVFITVTRLEKYKGVDTALKAMSLVVKKYPKTFYFVCGNGPDQQRLNHLCRELQLEKNVRFFHGITSEKLNDLYNVSDVCLLLTRTDYWEPQCEGFGIVILEAAACGIPAIGGRSGGISDAVAEGESGWLVDPEDPIAVSQIMTEAIENRELRMQLGKNALTRVLKDFKWTDVAQRILSEVRRNVRN